jgi:hypothetical protein
MTRPTFSSMRMPAKCGGDRAGGGRSVEDGSPHAPAMTCHPVPYGESGEFGFTIMSCSVLSLRRLGPLRIDLSQTANARVPNAILSCLRSRPCSRLWLSSRGYLDACQQGQRAARLSVTVSGPRAEWTWGVRAATGRRAGERAETYNQHTPAPCTPPRTALEAVRRSRERDVRYTVTGLYQHEHLDRVSSCLETSNVKRGKNRK